MSACQSCSPTYSFPKDNHLILGKEIRDFGVGLTRIGLQKPEPQNTIFGNVRLPLVHCSGYIDTHDSFARAADRDSIVDNVAGSTPAPGVGDVEALVQLQVSEACRTEGGIIHRMLGAIGYVRAIDPSVGMKQLS